MSLDAVPPPTPEPPWPRRELGVALLTGAALVVLAGVAETVRAGSAMQRFGSQGLAPRMVVLSFTRGLGPVYAGLVACLVVTAGLHASRSRRTLVPVAAASVIALYPLVVLLGVGSALVTAWRWLHVGPRDFVSFVEARDLGHGLLLSVVYVVARTLWVFIGHRLFAKRELTFGRKLFSTWLAFAGASLVVRLVPLCFGP